ncbi:MAG TPA: sugar phosphotransferase, partial [Gemmatimonadetes bacterium]|nr:sugar phosphotransferase [Gemmatimonadota bacterium]
MPDRVPDRVTEGPLDGGPCVDLVCPWVDGDDPGLHEDMRKYASDPGHLNPERTRDLYELLRYSLRSVAMYAGWVRNVYIITRRPQVPAWLDQDNPRVKVVHHDKLDGFGPYLPTFNSTAIESFVHAVPEVSDH